MTVATARTVPRRPLSHSPRRHSFFPWITCLLTLAAAPAAVAQQQDTVTLKVGAPRAVTITNEDYDGVYYSVQGGKGTSKFKWSDVASVSYANASQYYKALEAFGSGKVAEAIPLLEKLAADTKIRPVLRQGVLYALASSYQRSGQLDKAIATWQDLVKSFPKSRQLMNAGTALLTALVAKGDIPGAAKALDEFVASAKSAGVDASYQGGFGLLRARVLFEQKKYPEAQSQYASVAADNSVAPEIALAAKVGVALCAQMQNKAADAERGYRELTLADAPNSVLAGAWNGLGDLALADGMKRRDAEKLHDALLCYLRGVVLYVPMAEDTTDEYERALGGTAQAFKAIGEVETDADKKKLWLDRGKERLALLTSQFPNSRWLKPK